MTIRHLAFVGLLFLGFACSEALVADAQPSETSPPAAVEPTGPRFMSIDELISSVDTENMLDHIDELASEIGIRAAGTENERLAGDYVAYELESYGYLVQSSSFILHNGRMSSNLWAELPGESDEAILIGAHYDSKHPAPGANDNGSGIAVMLETARVLADVVPPRTIVFAAFGSEEIIDSNRDHHHYGSRHMATDQSIVDRLYCMNSLDMVGVGTELWIDNTGDADDGWRAYLFDCASEMGLPVHTGERRGWSDHEAFEAVGVPAAWVHWRYDSEYHKATDVPGRIRPGLLQKTAELMIRAILGLEGEEMVEVRELELSAVFQRKKKMSRVFQKSVPALSSVSSNCQMVAARDIYHRPGHVFRFR